MPSRRGLKPGRVSNVLVQYPRNIVVQHAAVASSLHYMAENYSHPFKIQDLVRFSDLSQRGFFKAFRRHVGQTPARVLRHLRIEHAKRLLIETEVSLPQLSAQCGYRSVNSFWVAFRQTTGIGPGQFQRQAQLPNGISIPENIQHRL